jgi:hypothetical protein
MKTIARLAVFACFIGLLSCGDELYNIQMDVSPVNITADGGQDEGCKSGCDE